MKVLLGIQSARRLTWFYDTIAKLDYIDIAIAHNMIESQAQNTIRQFFLERPYSHLMFVSDDAEILYDAPKMLMDDIEKEGYDIITGFSNNYEGSKDINVATYPPLCIERRKNMPIWYHEYKHMTFKDVERFKGYGTPIVPVWFVGFALTTMSRKVVEAWTPKGWFQRKTPIGMLDQCSDLWFSYQMSQLGFKRYCDLRVFVPHHPPARTNGWRNLLIGKEPQSLEFREAKKKGES